MAWTVPDQGEGDNDLQSILFQEYLEILADGISGRNCVLSGCAVTGGADMTPAVAKGAILQAGALVAVAAADVTIPTAHATLPRIDLIMISSGTLVVLSGTAAANPKPPNRQTDDVVLAAVYVPAGDTSIETSKITDMRVMREQGPIVIYKTTTAEVTNTTAAAINILNKAGSGVVIPSGLFLAGKILRVRIGGNYLLNSGTPTLTLTVIYGGTTMFADASVASLADADRGAWHLELLLVAQGTSDQALSGFLTRQPIEIARVAPTTGGPGDMAFADTSNRLGVTNFAGSAAVNSDTGDRTLQVQFTMSVSNANNEIVVEGATVELL